MSFTAAVITVSDKGARGERVDTSGPSLCRMLQAEDYDVVYTSIIPDEKDIIAAELIKCCDELKVHLVLTTGGTGFAHRDVTPEATMMVVERETPGIPELMRLASLKITPRGCLSRSKAGIRGGTLIVNLPGSEKASRENLEAVLPALDHGLEMLATIGSANCAEAAAKEETAKKKEKKTPPSVDEWLREAKKEVASGRIGMYLLHNGVVRETARQEVREGISSQAVTGMNFGYDSEKVNAAIEEAKKMDGIHMIKVWLNEGELEVGDDIMYVLIGGDIRPRVIDCLQTLVGKIKNECVSEKEVY